MTTPKTILVAVSDVFFYTKIRDVLKQADYSLERARSQDEVLGKARQAEPAAIVLNMNDEQLDAFETLKRLKEDARARDIPTLVFANHEEVDTWRSARALGVTKIVSRNEFSARTRDLIEEAIKARAVAPEMQ